MENPVIIFGANKTGALALDIFNANGILVYGFLDDDESLHNTEFNDISVLGRTDEDEFIQMIGKTCEAFVALEDTAERTELIKDITKKRKRKPANCIHPSIVISETTKVGSGNLIDQLAAISTNVEVKDNNWIGANVTIDHHSKLGSFVQIGSGTVIGSSCEIEDEVFIGSGVTVASGVKIAKGARVGAGSVVVADVAKEETVFGNPAKAV